MSTFDFDNLVGRDKVSLIYVAYFGRLPDPEGFAFWNNFFGIQTFNGFSSGEAALQITDLFLNQDETRANYTFFEDPSTASVEDIGLFLEEVYANLFNRPPDDLGKAFWSEQIVNRLEAGSGFSDILTQIIEGAQVDDIPAIDNKLEVANYYVQNIGEGFDLAQATNLATSVTGDDNTVPLAIAEIDAQAALNMPVDDGIPPRATISGIELQAAISPLSTQEEISVVGTQIQSGTAADDGIM